MRDDLFNDLQASVREMRLILHGKTQPSRVFAVESRGKKVLRDGCLISYGKIASLPRISLEILRNRKGQVDAQADPPDKVD